MANLKYYDVILSPVVSESSMSAWQICLTRKRRTSIASSA